MKTPHTPGPWLHRGKSDSVHRPSRTHPFGETIFKFDDEIGPSDADLNLILAAPELLEALKMAAQSLVWLAFGECRGFHDSVPTALEASEKARAAIAKATGEQS